MKSQQEIEKMKEVISDRIDRMQNMAFSNRTGGNERLANHYERECAKAIAEYNILIEVLR